jgi:hypothetical protein
MIGTLIASTFVFWVGFVLAVGVRLYFSLKAFVGNVFERALPAELVDKIVEPLPPRRKWIASKALELGRGHLAEKVFKVLLSQETVLGSVIKVAIYGTCGILLIGLNALIWYFGEVSPYIIISSSLAGLAFGYFVHRTAVEEVLEYLVTQVTGVSTKAIQRGAKQFGVELTADISKTN